MLSTKNRRKPGLFGRSVSLCTALFVVFTHIFVSTSFAQGEFGDRDPFQEEGKKKGANKQGTNKQGTNNQAQENEKRRPLPTSAQLRVATRTVKDLYGKSLSTRDETEAKAAVQVLVKDALETKDDWPVRYSMLKTAQDVYVELIDITSFVNVCESLSNDFEINGSKEIVDGITDMSKKVRNADQAKKVANASKSWATKFNQSKEFDQARKMISVMQTLARKLRDKNLTDEARELRSRVSKLEKLVDDYEKAKKILVKTPDHAEACLAAGKYFALIENNVQQSLIHFSKSDSEAIASAAKLDNNGMQMEAAEKWLNLGGRGSSDLQVFFLTRSRFHYASLVQKKSGIKKRQCERAIELIDKHLTVQTTSSNSPNPQNKSVNLLVKTTSKKFVLVYDPSSTSNYAVVVDASDAEGKGLKHADQISVDGNVPVDTTPFNLHKLIADGKEHKVTIVLSAESAKWNGIAYDGNYGIETTKSWILTDGYIKKSAN